jgi:glutamate N-acetyltransferase / amino-acid N-acetyltransferase
MKIDMTESYRVPGFVAGGIHAGIKANGLKDLALIYSAVPAKASGVFTTNAFKAAPVLLDQERIKSGVARAILVNSGNANAATGAQGYRDAVSMARFASRNLGIKEDHVLVASTGIIGHRLPIDKIESGIGRLVQGLREEGVPEAGEAIMTTDKFMKIASRQAIIGGKNVTVCGIAKGAGMIEPHMATLLAFVMTDVDIDLPVLRRTFKRAVNNSFNIITVDGCMSTNDTAIILANGVAGNPVITGSSKTLRTFYDMLVEVLGDLARSMVRDGEGATKVIDIIVEEANSAGDAKKIAYAVANSNLVKTAVFGCDPNWGRILQSAGASGVSLLPEKLRLFFEDIPVFADGQGIPGHENELAKIMAAETVRICIKLGMGDKTFQVCASDLSYDYVKINAQYHT